MPPTKPTISVNDLEPIDVADLTPLDASGAQYSAPRALAPNAKPRRPGDAIDQIMARGGPLSPTKRGSAASYGDPRGDRDRSVVSPKAAWSAIGSGVTDLLPQLPPHGDLLDIAAAAEPLPGVATTIRSIRNIGPTYDANLQRGYSPAISKLRTAVETSVPMGGVIARIGAPASSMASGKPITAEDNADALRGATTGLISLGMAGSGIRSARTGQPGLLGRTYIRATSRLPERMIGSIARSDSIPGARAVMARQVGTEGPAGSYPTENFAANVAKATDAAGADVWRMADAHTLANPSAVVDVAPLLEEPFSRRIQEVDKFSRGETNAVPQMERLTEQAEQRQRAAADASGLRDWQPGEPIPMTPTQLTRFTKAWRDSVKGGFERMEPTEQAAVLNLHDALKQSVPGIEDAMNDYHNLASYNESLQQTTAGIQGDALVPPLVETLRGAATRKIASGAGWKVPVAYGLNKLAPRGYQVVGSFKPGMAPAASASTLHVPTVNGEIIEEPNAPAASASKRLRLSSARSVPQLPAAPKSVIAVQQAAERQQVADIESARQQLVRGPLVAGGAIEPPHAPIQMPGRVSPKYVRERTSMLEAAPRSTGTPTADFGPKLPVKPKSVSARPATATPAPTPTASVDATTTAPLPKAPKPTAFDLVNGTSGQTASGHMSDVARQRMTRTQPLQQTVGPAETQLPASNTPKAPKQQSAPVAETAAVAAPAPTPTPSAATKPQLPHRLEEGAAVRVGRRSGTVRTGGRFVTERGPAYSVDLGNGKSAMVLEKDVKKPATAHSQQQRRTLSTPTAAPTPTPSVPTAASQRVSTATPAVPVAMPKPTPPSPAAAPKPATPPPAPPPSVPTVPRARIEAHARAFDIPVGKLLDAMDTDGSIESIVIKLGIGVNEAAQLAKDVKQLRNRKD